MQVLPAGSRIHRPFYAAECRVHYFFSATTAGVNQILFFKSRERCLIRFTPLALIDNWPIPFHSQFFERFQDFLRRARNFAHRIEILYPQQPFAFMSLCLDVTSHRRNKRAQMQRPRWGWSKASPVDPGWWIMTMTHRLMDEFDN